MPSLTIEITALDAARLAAIAGSRPPETVAAEILRDVLDDDAAMHPDAPEPCAIPEDGYAAVQEAGGYAATLEPRAGHPFSRHDDRTLRSMHAMKIGPAVIAKTLGRSVDEVRARLREIKQ